MRGLCSSACIVADPACTVQNRTAERNDQSENIEVAKLGNIIRIHEALSGNTVPHDRGDIVGPGEVQDDITDDDDEHRVAEESLHAVCNQKGNSAAGKNKQQSQSQAETDDDGVTGQIDTADHDSVRQAEVIDEEVGCDCGTDGVGDHFRNGSQSCAEDTEEFAAVAHFEELTHGKTAGFTPAVHTVSGKSDEYADRRGDCAPETDGETGLIVLFASCDQRDNGKSGGEVTDRDYVTSSDSSGCQIVDNPSCVPA